MTAAIPKIERYLPENFAILPEKVNSEIINSINTILSGLGFQKRIGENETLRAVRGFSGETLFLRSSLDAVIIYQQESRGNGEQFIIDSYDPDGNHRMTTISASEKTLKVLNDVVENYQDYLVVNSEVLDTAIRYDKFVDGNDVTFVVYGDHKFLTVNDYIILQESIARGEIIDEVLYHEINCIHTDTCEDCGTVAGYVNTGEVNEDNKPIYERAVMFSVWVDNP